jgi:hypothetical protein
MQKKIWTWSFALLGGLLAFAGCMKSGEDATGPRPETVSVLDASHGGARISLPDIDPAALAALEKGAGDTTVPDTLAKAWFELSITGENMQEQSYRFPITTRGGQIIEIKGIPAGKKRSFHGSLWNGKRVLTHEGITVADIQAGVYADIRLFLAKAGGSASICVIIEGQKLPACAGDTLSPPVDPWPVPDSGANAGCWQLASDWITGKVKFYGTPLDGSMGVLLRDSGSALYFTLWSRQGDTLAAVLISPDNGAKWIFRGVILSAGAVWTGTITHATLGKTAPFSAKTLPCGMVVEPGKTPPDSVPVPPKPDPIPVDAIPMPGSGAKETKLCFEMRFDYGKDACELSGLAKMTFLDGKILNGNMTVADRPSRDYWRTMGQYDSGSISFYGVTAEASGSPRDTLSLKGRIGAGATMAKGEYVRLPSGKAGNWTMNAVACGAWTPVYPDSSCFATAK